VVDKQVRASIGPWKRDKVATLLSFGVWTCPATLLGPLHDKFRSVVVRWHLLRFVLSPPPPLLLGHQSAPVSNRYINWFQTLMQPSLGVSRCCLRSMQVGYQPSSVAGASCCMGWHHHCVSWKELQSRRCLVGAASMMVVGSVCTHWLFAMPCLYSACGFCLLWSFGAIHTHGVSAFVIGRC
jgi:hypothetical protein